jgi:hypothetical protein
VSVIFHLAAHEDWERANSAGVDTTASLHDDGFIDCSTAPRHAAVASARFEGRVDGPMDLDAVFEPRHTSQGRTDGSTRTRRQAGLRPASWRYHGVLTGWRGPRYRHG